MNPKSKLDAGVHEKDENEISRGVGSVQVGHQLICCRGFDHALYGGGLFFCRSSTISVSPFV